MFTTSTIFASVLLFQGFNTGGAAAVSLLGGFFTTFLGVYLLNMNKNAEAGPPRSSYVDERHSLGGRHRPSEERLNDSFELAPQVESRNNEPFVLDQEENDEQRLPRFHDIPRP